MKIILFMIFLCGILYSCKMETKIIYKSSQINNLPSDTLNVKWVSSSFKTGYMKVKLNNGEKLFFPPDSVWGVNYSNNLNYRFFKSNYYYVRQMDSLIIYSQRHSGYKSGHTHYYFSETLNSEVYSLNGKNLKQVFDDDTCFLNSLNTKFKWYQSYSSFNNDKKTYRIIELYNNCK